MDKWAWISQAILLKTDGYSRKAMDTDINDSIIGMVSITIFETLFWMELGDGSFDFQMKHQVV